MLSDKKLHVISFFFFSLFFHETKLELLAKVSGGTAVQGIYQISAKSNGLLTEIFQSVLVF